MHKLEINIINNVQDALNRKYTLTHSDETGMRFLFIDSTYAEEEYDELNDQVTSEWCLVNNKIIFSVSCPIFCQASKYSMNERYEIFKRHMPRAIRAILFGDQEYILANNYLLESKIHVFYIYSLEYYRVEQLGLVGDFIK
ncbi:MAG: hypothetical protein CVV02_11735 [Firmicutes bacterium HGW-Firmicutes-7]|nr:MAG: hypothetical protein CVV02_11735 [Firmicutes bacterium HGW-Firmicutes-7]